MTGEAELTYERAPHILNTSSNLLGFTFLILTSTRIVGLPSDSIIPKIAAGCVAIFAISSFFVILVDTRKVAQAWSLL